VDEVEALRSKVNDAAAVTDSLHDHREKWLKQTSDLKTQIARFDTLLYNCHRRLSLFQALGPWPRTSYKNEGNTDI